MSFLARRATRDHALLLKAIEYGSAAARKANGALGRTALQKVVYFLFSAGVPTRYRFDIHHFGPFCAEILDDVDDLVADEFVSDRSRDPKFSDYEITSGAKPVCAAHGAFLGKYDSAIRKIASLAALPASRLELLSTVHFLARWDIDGGCGVPGQRRLARRVKEFKKDKFTSEEIEEAYGQLRRARVLPAR